MSAPFAQAVAGRVLSVEVTPLRTAKDSRRYTLTLHPTKAAAPTEIIVSELWLPASSLDVKVSDAAATVRIESKLAGAKLTDGVAYPAAAKVVVNHAQSAGAAKPVRITVTAKQ